MKKSDAIEMLGGSVAEAAKRLEVTYQAVDKWPEELPLRIADRVLGAYARTNSLLLADPTPQPTPTPPPPEPQRAEQGVTNA